MDIEEFNSTMGSMRCKYCKAIPEAPFDGTILITKEGGLIGCQIVCINCSERIDEAMKIRRNNEDTGSL